MKSKLISGLVLLFIITCYSSFGQKAPIKFGKVEMKDLQMTEYEPDPDAPAVILCSYGYYNADNNRFTHNYRVKILKKEGYQLANRKFQTSKKSNVRGKTFNLVDGEIVVDKLSSESTYREKVTENFYLLNVAMPNVKEGSIIDLEIQSGFPLRWYFQEDIPIIKSELRIEDLEYLEYNKNFFGYEQLTLNESHRWVAEDVPAFKEEPFMDSRENYITKFEFDITKVSIPGYYYEDIAGTWEAVSESFMEYEYFGLALKTGPALNKKAKEIEENISSPEDKIKAAVDFIKELHYNGSERCFTTEVSFNYNLREKTGNSADMNLMLVKLLKKMDFTVYPVVLSTKENGYLSPVFPSINKLNYVLAYVKLEEEYILVDATDDLLPYYLLPVNCLNWRGRLIDEGLDQWVDLNAKRKDKKLLFYNLNLQDDMTLTGDISYRRDDYAAYNFRKKLEKYSDTDEYIESLEDKHHGIEITISSIENLDNIYESVKDSYEVNISDWAYSMDSTIYLQLAFFEKIKENPFKAKERKYPVDFSYPIEEFGIIKINLPDNCEVTELPKPVKFVLPDNGASFQFVTNQVGNTINIQYRLFINKTLFVLDEYEELKAFYNEIIKKEAEPIVLKLNGYEL